MRIVIAGSRAFEDYPLLRRKMDRIAAGLAEVTVLSGGAAGADQLGERWAFERWHTVEIYRPDWDTHGKRAGFLRNEEMAAAAGEGGGCVVFWDGASRGSAHMIEMARKYGLQLRVVKFGKASTEKNP